MVIGYQHILVLYFMMLKKLFSQWFSPATPSLPNEKFRQNISIEEPTQLTIAHLDRWMLLPSYEKSTILHLLAEHESMDDIPYDYFETADITSDLTPQIIVNLTKWGYSFHFEQWHHAFREYQYAYFYNPDNHLDFHENIYTSLQIPHFQYRTLRPEEVSWFWDDVALISQMLFDNFRPKHKNIAIFMMNEMFQWLEHNPELEVGHLLNPLYCLINEHHHVRTTSLYLNCDEARDFWQTFDQRIAPWLTCKTYALTGPKNQRRLIPERTQRQHYQTLQRLGITKESDLFHSYMANQPFHAEISLSFG